MESFWAFLSITGLFMAMLILKRLIAWRFCVLCVSVALTWVGLLIGYKFGYFQDVILLSLLAGMSITGIYYLAEKGLPAKLMLFRLPGLLSLVLLIYTLLAGFELLTTVLLAGLWLIYGGLYLYRHSPKLKPAIEHILACCRDW